MSRPNGQQQSRAAPRLELGRIVITRSALSALSGEEVACALARHARGDWGQLEVDDRKANDRALQEGMRLLSAYRSLTGAKFWIITEADRSTTTVLLPEDY